MNKTTTVFPTAYNSMNNNSGKSSQIGVRGSMDAGQKKNA